MQQFSSLTTLIIEACQTASNRLKRDFGEIENLQNTPTGANTFVQKALERTQAHLIKSFQYARPKYSIIINDKKVVQGTDIGHTFYIDPINGIQSFLRGLEGFKIFIALQEQKETIAAIMFDPLSEGCFVAEKNKGAFLYHPYRSQRLRVGRREKDFFFGTNISDNKTFNHKTDCVGSLIAGVCGGKYDAIILNDLNETEEKTAELFISESGGHLEKSKDKIILSSLAALHTVKTID
ncbi:MAG: hypothetical protein JXQ74_01670 [Alphaproteobacteria bacterium]|nr:hypothetical protein [Alphaproteobacteria bacterium]